MFSFKRTDHGFEVFVKNFALKFFNKKATNSTVYTLNQKHSNYIATGPNETEGDGFLIGASILKAGVWSADCMPIAIFDNFQACLLHVGWRGLKSGIILEALRLLKKPQFAVIGPSARVCCYEVQEDFLENFESKFFSQKEGKIFFNLQRTALSQLKIPTLEISICTICNHAWHSFRREKTKINNLTTLEITS